MRVCHGNPLTSLLRKAFQGFREAGPWFDRLSNFYSHRFCISLALPQVEEVSLVRPPDSGKAPDQRHAQGSCFTSVETFEHMVPLRNYSEGRKL